MKTMTKTELVTALSDKSGMAKKDVDAVLAALTDVASETMAQGGALTLPGLSKLACRERAELMVRNPATGEQMQKPADKAVKFTIAKALKDTVNA